MELFAKRVSFEEVKPWRDLYRHEMNCQLVFDSFHARQGWTEEYALLVLGTPAGYGSIVSAGPWNGKRNIFEFYVLPHYRTHLFDLFSQLLQTAGATGIEAQSNDAILTVMMRTFAHDVAPWSVLFRDGLWTNRSVNECIFRSATPEDAAGIQAQELDEGAEWVISMDGKIVATGGLKFHYNRPYGDIYMSVAESHRRRGLGAYMVQELKRVCYERGSVPAARCNTDNLASRKTLQRAGLVPCGHLLSGSLT